MEIFKVSVTRNGSEFSLSLPEEEAKINDLLDMNHGAEDTITVTDDGFLYDLEKMRLTADGLRRLNFLARRLDDMEPEKLAAFNAVYETFADSEHPDIDRIINMTYGLEAVSVEPYENEADLGEHAIAEGLIPELDEVPAELLGLIDRGTVGNMMLELNGGSFHNGYYVRLNGYEVPQVFDGSVPENDAVIALEYDGYATGSTVCFGLPVTGTELAALIARGGSLPKAVHSEYDCINEAAMRGETDVETLNAIAERLSVMDREAVVKYKAVLRAERPATAAAMLDVAEHIDEYEFERDICTAADFGRHYLEAMLLPEFDTSLLDFLEFERMGIEAAAILGATITDYGAISARGGHLDDMVYERTPVVFADEQDAPDMPDVEPDNQGESAEVPEQSEDAEGGREISEDDDTPHVLFGPADPDTPVFEGFEAEDESFPYFDGEDDVFIPDDDYDEYEGADLSAEDNGQYFIP